MADPHYTSDWSKPDTFYGGYVQYRIELKQTAHGWFQRHIWRKADGDTRTDAWIPSFDHTGRLDRYTQIGDAA